MNSNEEIFTISIYPNGLSRAASTLVFDSLEEKSEYIIKESSYCRNEENLYLSSVGGEKRKEMKELFAAKRVDFAKKQHFAPTKTNKTVWKKTQIAQSPPPKEVA